MTWLDTQPTDKVDAALADYVKMGRPMAGHTDDDRFGLWLLLVDRKISRFAGIGLFDLADTNSRDAYEAGESPKEHAREALASDDTFSAMFGGE